MVRVLAVADEESAALTPERLGAWAVDLVVSAGDLGWAYLEYLADATDRPLVFVPGNHDPALRSVQLHRRGLWLDHGLPVDDPRPLGGINADLRVVTAAGLRIAGLGGCVRYRPGPHQYDQREFARRARRLRRAARRSGAVDILLTHAPPAGLGDAADPPHHGIEALHDVLDALRPTWHLHGHVHPHGQPAPDRQRGDTTLVNVIPHRVLEINPKDDDVRQWLPAR